MAYKLDIISDRGLVYLSNTFLKNDSTYSHVPTSVTANFRFDLPNDGNLGLRLLYRTGTTIQPPSNSADILLVMNNLNFTLVTQIGIAAERANFFTASTSTEFHYIGISPQSDPTQRVYYKIISINTTAGTPDFWVLNVQYDHGNLSSLSDYTNILVTTHSNYDIHSPRNYYAPFGSVLSVEGDRDAINTLLQEPFWIVWSQYATQFTLTSPEPTNPNYGRGEFALVANTSDVLLTYTITKDSLAYDPYTFYLKYKTPAQIENPSNFPL